jgi:hypothetical protein
MAYAQHVVAEARTGKLLAPPQIDRLARNLNCLAGITLRGAFRASLNDVQWQSTLDFARRFQVSGAPGWDLAQIRKGYGSGRLKDCM